MAAVAAEVADILEAARYVSAEHVAAAAAIPVAVFVALSAAAAAKTLKLL